MANKFTFLQNRRKRRRETEVEEEEAIFKRRLVSFGKLVESAIFANILIVGAVSVNIKSRKPRIKDKTGKQVNYGGRRHGGRRYIPIMVEGGIYQKKSSPGKCG